MRRRIAIALGLVLLLQTLHVIASPKDEARFLSRMVWEENARWFGGISALELSDDGQAFTIITDRGFGAFGKLERSEGQLQDATIFRSFPLRVKGQLPDPVLGFDSEGLALKSDGTWVVSFEREHKLRAYPRRGAFADAIPVHSLFSGLPENGGLEALAIDTAGHLYAIPERFLQRGNAIPVFRLQDEDWQIAFHLKKKAGFLPVGADFDDQGRLYVLERSYALVGFRSRVRRLTLDGGRPVSEDILLQSQVGAYDNLEGIAVWRDTDDKIRITMVSDDNFNSFQRTELVEFLLP